MSPVESNKDVGPIRSHLYNYTFAKAEAEKGKNSKIIFRIDDSNREKHTKEKAMEIYRFFNETLGFQFDVTPDNAQQEIGQSVFQSERQEVYSKYLEELFDKHVAFIDKESGLVLFDIKRFIQEYSDTLEIDDLVKGKIKFKLEENLKRGQLFFPLMRSDKSALYHLSSVVDDAAFEVTHVIRGQDKLSIAEFQEMVRVSFGFEPKKYLHTPMLLDAEGRLPKGAVKFDDFLQKGIVPQALISYMISSGYGDPEAIYPSLEEFIKNFDYKKIHRNNGKFDSKRLDYINKKLLEEVTPDIYVNSIVLYLAKNNQAALAERLKTDDALDALLVSFRREPAEAVEILKSILVPEYEEIDDEKSSLLSILCDDLEKTGGEFPSAGKLHLDKKSVYNAMRWILVGRWAFPGIDKVFNYLKAHNLIDHRISLARSLIKKKGMEQEKYNSPENYEMKGEIVDRLFSEQLLSTNEIEKKYPPRELGQGAMVTRIAPSPTGFMHIGSLYTALVSERLAHQSEGIFYLRIEDTDKKREVEGASDLIAETLSHYQLQTDEGPNITGGEQGEYGPYKQSERAGIYKAYAKLLVEKGVAYPCFCSPEEIEEIRSQQELKRVQPGYYGEWAKWRDKPNEEILQAMNDNKPYVIRFKSDGNFNNKIFFHDILKGDRELAESQQDIVLIKSDGLPTYHFAHVVDDHLMGTTHVVRGDEWLSSVPLHLQLFKAMGWTAPKYGHLSPIQKIEGESRRKLSKRKDPEASVSYYDERGYPKDAVVEYLLNLANSNFEDWRKANRGKNYQEFPLAVEKMSGSSGALFDFIKLNDISKEIISRYSAEDIYKQGILWGEKYDLKLAEIMKENPDYTKRILNIERGIGVKTRKDITKWVDIREYIVYFFDQYFHINREDIARDLSGLDIANVKTIIQSFIRSYNENDPADTWFEKIKNIAREQSYAESAKMYKKEPSKYRGNVADVAKIFRVLLTGKTQTPDLYSIMQIMGKERVIKRLSILEETPK
jgi:glutamyl-tRNA synthetase